MAPLKVTFDSNTWRKVATPENFPKDPIGRDYTKIRDAITDKRLTPFISETVFTLEAIQKKDRKKFFRDYDAVFEAKEIEREDGAFGIELSIGPNAKAHPGNTGFLKEHFEDASKLGFNIISMPRIAGITNKDIEGLKYKIDKGALGSYHAKVFEVGRRITDLHAGDYDIKQIGLKYDSNSWFQGIGKAPDSENINIARAVAEWSDGDSIASHIAIGGDYFCTNDAGVSAGSSSVLSSANLEILKREFGLSTITPSKLATLL